MYIVYIGCGRIRYTPEMITMYHSQLQNGVCYACLTRMLEAVLTTQYSLLPTLY